MSEAVKKPSTDAGAPPAARTANDEIAYCKIHPGLGIARLGNSPEEFFIGPLAPGEIADPEGGFKDRHGRIKRQAAEFRVYAYNKSGVAIRELTADEAEVHWTVHLANRKAEYDMFLGRFWQSQYPEYYKKNPDRTPPRNQEVTGDDRQRLVIDPGPRTIAGRKSKPVEFDGGQIGPLPYTIISEGVLDESDPENIIVTTGNAECVRGTRTGYMNEVYPRLQNQRPAECPADVPGKVIPPVGMSRKVEVPLGELRTDDKGRLLVLGGLGRSESLIPNNELGFLNVDSYFANNDYWFDDTSDGPVTASVVLKDGRRMECADKAWVAVTPPKYAPAARVLTTLYEVALETWHKKSGELPPGTVSFTKDIYPLLERLNQYHWLNAAATRGHGPGPGQGGDFLGSPGMFDSMHRKGTEHLRAKQHLFSRLRKPDLVAQTPDAHDTPESLKYASNFYMPQMSGDGGEPQMPEDNTAKTPVLGSLYVTWLTLTAEQYRRFERWAKDDFVDDWSQPPRYRPIWEYPTAEQGQPSIKGRSIPAWEERSTQASR